MPVGAPSGPDPHAAGSTRRSSWWVIQTLQTGRMSNLAPPTLSVQMATAKPKNAIAGPYLSKDAAQSFIDKALQGGSLDLNPLNWLSDLGGKLASGIESGFVTLIKDLWNVVVGPLEVLLGALIGMWVLTIYFKNDIMSLAKIVTMAAV